MKDNEEANLRLILRYKSWQQDLENRAKSKVLSLQFGKVTMQGVLRSGSLQNHREDDGFSQ